MSRYEIPETWRWIKLSEVSEVVGGGTPRRNIQRYFGGDILWATPTDVTSLNDIHISKTEETITEEGLASSSTRLLPENSVLMTSRATIGVTAINKYPMATNQGFANFICNSDLIESEYLARYLAWATDRLIRVAYGTTFKEISRSTLKRFEIPLPTLPEQREIVKILRQADRLRQLRLEADRTSEQLLLSIFNKMFQKPKSTWIRCKLGDVISLEAGKNFAAKPNPVEKGKWGILKVSAVTYGTFLPEENKELPDDADPNLDYQVKKDDLLITRANTAELLGASAIVRTISQNLLLPDKIWRAVFNGKYSSNPHFLYGLLNTARIRNEISRRATGTSGSMKNISQSNFLDIVIQLPSEDEQKNFSEIAKSIWQDVQDCQADAASELTRLTESIQVNAFVGSLTNEYRIQNAADLANKAQERDRLLDAGMETEVQEIDIPVEVRSNIRSKLSESQRELITAVEKQDGYIIVDDLLSSSQSPANQIQRNLELLTKVGLLKAVKISAAPGALGQILFTTVYRSLQSDDDSRDTDLSVLGEAQEE